MDWLKWFGFPYDPFFDKPLESPSELETLLVVSRTLKEELGGFVSQIRKVPQICLIAGERGVGKSTAMYYAAELLRREGGLPVYIGLHHTQIDACKKPVEELKRDLLEIVSVEIIRCLYSYHPEHFERNKRRMIELMKFLGYSFDSSAGFLPDLTTYHLGYPDLEKHNIELTDFVKNLGLSLLLMVDNLDKVKDVESVQTFLGSAFGQTFFGNIRQRGASIFFAVAPKFLEIQLKDRDLNYLSHTINIPIIVPTQAIDLINKRIENCNVPPPSNPFTKKAVMKICLNKHGITRDILTEARSLCMSAGNLEVSRIDDKFVDSGLVSFNPNRAFYELMDSSREVKKSIMHLLDLQSRLNPEQCLKAGSALQYIAKGETAKIPDEVHIALLDLGIIVQKPGQKRKYTFSAEVEQLLKACEAKGWKRVDFLGWITTTEGHQVAVTGTPGLRVSQAIEGFGPFLDPTKSMVRFRIKSTEQDFKSKELWSDAWARMKLAKGMMSKIGSLSWDDIDTKTVYLDLYSAMINFLVAFSKLYLTTVSKETPWVRSLKRFDLVRSTKSIIQREVGRDIVSWHRILGFRAKTLGIRHGQISPSHADLKEALMDSEIVINELASLWRDVLKKEKLVPIPTDMRVQNAIAKVTAIASILRYSVDKPEYMSVEVDSEKAYRLGLLSYPTDKATFDVVREKQIKDEMGQSRKSFFIACVHPIELGRASSKDVLGFISKCKYLLDVVESKEDSLSDYWPLYYLVFVSLNGFDVGISAALEAAEIPKTSKITLLNDSRLASLKNDLETTVGLGRAEGEFENLGSRSLEDLLRLRIKAVDAIRDKYEKETTVMLADLKEFTRRTEEDSIESAEAVQRLSDILDEKVRENGGSGTQTEGDSYIASFEQPENAVIAALSALEELEKYNKRVDSKKQIFVRIGINTGFAYFRKGQPFVGTVVNLTSRAMREVEAGKVVVTYYTKRKIKSQKSFRLISIGLRLLKGFDKPIELFEAQRRTE